MEFLKEKYWTLMQDNVTAKKGKKFENLVMDILELHYGKDCWQPSKASWDGSKDFFWYNENENMWAECKNYKSAIGLKVVSNSLIMAEIYNVSTLLFFSYSSINENTKVKILKYADDEDMKVFFFDDIALESLIFQYWDALGKKYFPNYTEGCNLPLQPPRVLFKAYKNPLDYKYDNSDELDNINLFHMFEIDIFLINTGTQKYNYTIQFEQVSVTPLEAFDIYPEALKKERQYITLNAFESVVYKVYVTPCVFFSKMKLPNIIVQNSIQKIIKDVTKFETKTFTCNSIDTQRLVGKEYEKIVDEFTLNLKTQKRKFNAFCIEGESGTGKTKLLNCCTIEAMKLGKKVLKFDSSYNGENSNLATKNLIKEIIIALYDLGNEDIVALIENSMKKETVVIDEHVKTAFMMIADFWKEHTEYEYKKLIDNYISIIFEKLASKEYLLVIDNVQFFDRIIVYFLLKLVYLGVNCNHNCQLDVLLVINSDYLGANIDVVNFLSTLKDFNFVKSIHGFRNTRECEEFLQELLLFGEAADEGIRNQIVERTNRNPYFIMQYVRLLDDCGLLDRKENYYIVNDSIKFMTSVNEMPSSIDELLLRRWEYCITYNDEQKCAYLLSCLHLWEYLFDEDISILGIDTDILASLNKLSFVLSKDKNGFKVYTLQHDLLEKFFVNYYSNFASIAASEAANNGLNINRGQFQDTFVQLHKKENYDLQQLHFFVNQIPYVKLAGEYYKLLYKKIFSYIPNDKNLASWLKIITNYCANTRDILGSAALLVRYDTFINLKSKYSKVLGTPEYGHLLFYFSEALDATGEYEKAYELILEYVKNIEETSNYICQTEFKKIVVEAYNRLHVYRRHQCVKPLEDSITMDWINKAEQLACEIDYFKFQYVNSSDRGYLYYALPLNDISSQKVYLYWEHACKIFEQHKIPEKTLNYYRKRVQLCLLRGDSLSAIEICKQAIEYINHGTYSYQKLFFYWWFYLALIESYLQKDPTRYFNEIDVCFDKINQYEVLLNSSKKFYILQLKAIFLFYKKQSDKALATNIECIEQLKNSKYKSKIDNVQMQLMHNECIIKGEETQDVVSSLIHTRDMLFNLPCL